MSKQIYFLDDTNLGLDVQDPGIANVIKKHNIKWEGTNDLEYFRSQMQQHKPDIAYTPSADFHRLLRKGDTYFRALAIPTSKYTGQVNLPSVLVVRKDDSAKSLLDLKGAKYAYINKSCTSSWFPPAIMLPQNYSKSERMEQFLDPISVADIPGGKPWQGQIDAVVSNDVRATMVPEDVWKSDPKNAEKTKIIDRWNDSVGPHIVVRQDLDEKVCEELLTALVRWRPKWEGVYGAMKPYYVADAMAFLHALDGLPEDF